MGCVCSTSLGGRWQNGRMNCPHCGAPLDDDPEVCPYCEEPLVEQSEPGATKAVITVNLKKGNPDSEFALARLDAAINSHRARGTSALRLIHGYGSKGLGGIIRNVVRDRLENLRYNRDILDFIPGEDLGRADGSRFRRSFQPEPGDVGNEGMTIVIL